MTDRPRLIEAEWESLLEELELDDASDFQVEQLRRAFFSGAMAYSTLVIASIGSGDQTLMRRRRF